MRNNLVRTNANVLKLSPVYLSNKEIIMHCDHFVTRQLTIARSRRPAKDSRGCPVLEHSTLIYDEFEAFPCPNCNLQIACWAIMATDLLAYRANQST